MTMNNGKSFFDMDVGKMFAGFSFPSFDVESILASQRKNLEALTHANQLAVEGVQALAKRQVEIVGHAMEEASAVLRELTQSGTPEENWPRMPTSPRRHTRRFWLRRANFPN